MRRSDIPIQVTVSDGANFTYESTLSEFIEEHEISITKHNINDLYKHISERGEAEFDAGIVSYHIKVRFDGGLTGLVVDLRSFACSKAKPSVAELLSVALSWPSVYNRRRNSRDSSTLCIVDHFNHIG